jgi:hypothetical protein
MTRTHVLRKPLFASATGETRQQRVEREGAVNPVVS